MLRGWRREWRSFDERAEQLRPTIAHRRLQERRNYRAAASGAFQLCLPGLENQGLRVVQEAAGIEFLPVFVGANTSKRPVSRHCLS